MPVTVSVAMTIAKTMVNAIYFMSIIVIKGTMDNVRLMNNNWWSMVNCRWGSNVD